MALTVRFTKRLRIGGPGRGAETPLFGGGDPTPMAKWLQSGVRRDVCLVLYGADELRLKELETRLQDHYDERFEPERFRRKVEKLVDRDHLERRTEGLHDVYALTDDGAAAVEAHLSWARETTGL